MFGKVKEAGKFVHLHSDGDISAIYDDLIEIGLDIYNPFQPEILDVLEIKRKYGHKLCFHGGIGLQGVLLYGDDAQVKDYARQMIKEIGTGGGYILSQAHPDGILGDIPVENIMALFESVWEQ